MKQNNEGRLECVRRSVEMKSRVNSKRRQQGKTGIGGLLLLLLGMLMIILAFYDPQIEIEELKRLQNLAEGNEQVQSELRSFLKTKAS